jgi:hypothetical protein
MAELEYIDEVHDLLQGITLDEPSLFVAFPLVTPIVDGLTRSFFDDSFLDDATMPPETMLPEGRFTELSLDIDGDTVMDQGDIPMATDPVAQNFGPTVEDVPAPNTKTVVKR